MPSTPEPAVNPFDPPGSLEHSDSERPYERLDRMARRIFLAWERLRWIYNGVLATVVLLMFTIYHTPTDMPFTRILGIVVPAFLANMCFFMGPVVETYVAWLGLRTDVLRLGMMFAGTAASALLAAVWMVAVLNPTL